MGDEWQAVQHWVEEDGTRVRSLVALPGDLSQRRYARVATAERSFIVASYPPEIRATCARFLRTTARLEAAGVRVPRVFRADIELGLTLLEDLGPTTLRDAEGRLWRELESSYREAVAIIGRIQGLSAQHCDDLNPRLDAALMSRELDQTRRVFLDPWVRTSDSGLDREVAWALEGICVGLEEGGLVPCHRDFMARNLVAAPGGLAVLDHQDLRLGPRAYDLASLLNDSLFPPPEFEDEVLGWAGKREVGRDLYDRAVVQRSLKAVGTYALFASRGQRRHVPLIEPSLGRALQAMTRLPETRELAVRWRPALIEGARRLCATLKTA